MACQYYLLDMTGTKFGACKCGYAKSEHATIVDAAVAKKWWDEKDKPPAPAAAAVIEYEPGACDNYHVNMSGSEFGICTCGFKKADHGKPKVPKQKPSSAQPAAKPAAAPVVVAAPAPPPQRAPAKSAPASSKPCDHFEIDLGGTFGYCKCGFSHEEHKQAGTIPAHERPVFAGGHAAEHRPTVVQPKGARSKQEHPCDHYQVDTAGKTFGDCMCGHAKNKHKQFGHSKHNEDEPASAAVPPPPEPAIVVRDGTHPCAVFELNMHNTGGYGACLCGFSRVDHENFHSDPGAWKEIRATLTKPKEFT